MQGLFDACSDIISKFCKYKYNHNNSEERAISSFGKFEKVICSLGDEHEAFKDVGKKFYDEYKEFLTREKKSSWYRYSMIIHLYDKEGKVVPGPALYLSDIYKMGEYVNEKNPPISLKEETCTSHLTTMLFRYISKVVPEFDKTITRAEVPPLDFTKIGDLFTNFLDVVPGVDGGNKEEIRSVINNFVSGPKMGEIVSSITQAVNGEGGTANVDIMGVIQDITKNLKDK